MSKTEEAAYKAYPYNGDYRGQGDYDRKIREAYINGYHQAEKDLMENKHEKSWRLDEKLWSGIKDVEEASYQYVYDASNDWAYDYPTWNDVKDAFKAGSEWKENLELSPEDVYDIWRLYNEVCSEGQIFGHNETSEEVLKRFKNYKKDLTI